MPRYQLKNTVIPRTVWLHQNSITLTIAAPEKCNIPGTQNKDFKIAMINYVQGP